jgi:hypothetical protein
LEKGFVFSARNTWHFGNMCLLIHNALLMIHMHQVAK